MTSSSLLLPPPPTVYPPSFVFPSPGKESTHFSKRALLRHKRASSSLITTPAALPFLSHRLLSPIPLPPPKVPTMSFSDAIAIHAKSLSLSLSLYLGAIVLARPPISSTKFARPCDPRANLVSNYRDFISKYSAVISCTFILGGKKNYSICWFSQNV